MSKWFLFCIIIICISNRLLLQPHPVQSVLLHLEILAQASRLVVKSVCSKAISVLLAFDLKIFGKLCARFFLSLQGEALCTLFLRPLFLFLGGALNTLQAFHMLHGLGGAFLFGVQLFLCKVLLHGFGCPLLHLMGLHRLLGMKSGCLLNPLLAKPQSCRQSSTLWWWFPCLGAFPRFLREHPFSRLRPKETHGSSRILAWFVVSQLGLSSPMNFLRQACLFPSILP